MCLLVCDVRLNGTWEEPQWHPAQAWLLLSLLCIQCEQRVVHVALRDSNGRAHPVMADVGCRNTVFGAEAQAASKHLDAWRQAGIRHYRLEFVHESAGQVERIAGAFRANLDGAMPSHDLARLPGRVAPLGTTEGSLLVPDS
jgi:putative protease